MTTSTLSPNTVPYKSQRIVSMRAQLLGLFTLLFTIVFSLAAYWLYSYIDSVVVNKIEQDLTDTLKGAVISIDGDQLAALGKDGVANEEGYSDDPRYNDIMRAFKEIHTIEPRAYPFVYVPGEKENQIFYLVDLQAVEEPSRSAKFKEENASAVIQTKGLKELTVRPGDNSSGKFGTYKDDWGEWVTAYAPIYNSKGEVVGGMGIDFTADYVNEFRTSVLQKVEIAFVLIFIVMFLLIWVMTGSFTRPITQLTNIADKIGSGDYQHQDNLNWIINKRMVRDELSSMAQAFTIMVEKVVTREQTLRQQVRELKIEINEAKRKAQVDEIVETDFFRDLRTKADNLRNRMNDGEKKSGS